MQLFLSCHYFGQFFEQFCTVHDFFKYSTDNNNIMCKTITNYKEQGNALVFDFTGHDILLLPLCMAMPFFTA